MENVQMCCEEELQLERLLKWKKKRETKAKTKVYLIHQAHNIRMKPSNPFD